MAKLKIKSAPAVPVPVQETPKGAGWAYYVIPPLLIIGVFWYCSRNAHKVSAPAPAQPAVAAAPATPAQEQPADADETAETTTQPVTEQPAATPATDDDFTGGDTAQDESQQKETEE